MVRIVLIVWLGWIGCGVAVQGQVLGTISGTIVDAVTGTPVRDVHVFLDQTTQGAITTASGQFSLRDVPLGTYTWVTSHLGYTRATGSITLTSERPVSLSIRLQPVTYTLETVVIAAKRSRAWKRHLRQFNKLFLGTTRRARLVTLRNPEVLALEYDRKRNVLTASASAPLEIENHALGYSITFHLQQFRARNDTLSYTGHAFFEEMTPPDEQTRARWQAGRQKAYEGSLPHFLNLLIGETLEKGPYTLYASTPTPSVIFPGRYAHERELVFDGQLRIVYMNPDGPDETSYLESTLRSIYLDQEGHLIDPTTVLIHGHWSETRMALMLPRDFHPDASDLK